MLDIGVCVSFVAVLESDSEILGWETYNAFHTTNQQQAPTGLLRSRTLQNPIWNPVNPDAHAILTQFKYQIYLINSENKIIKYYEIYRNPTRWALFRHVGNVHRCISIYFKWRILTSFVLSEEIYITPWLEVIIANTDFFEHYFPIYNNKYSYLP